MADRQMRNAWRLAAFAAIGLFGSLAGAPPVWAQNATWLANPTVAGPVAGTFDFDANANWNPATVPAGTATFGVSNGTNISFSLPATVLGGFTFNAGASL